MSYLNAIWDKLDVFIVYKNQINLQIENFLTTINYFNQTKNYDIELHQILDKIYKEFNN